MARQRETPARRGRRAGRWPLAVLIVLVALAAAGWIGGCVSTVMPPAAPEDPETVYLITDARHVGVALPDPEGGLVDYAFGDWDWYACNHDRWYHVFDTVLWPTRATLGRQRLATRDPASLRGRYPGGAVRPFSAARERVDALYGQLEAEFRAHEAEAVYNDRFDFRFVPLGRSYWFLHNCNDVTAAWLRELGCSVSWVPIRLGVGLAAPPD
ncbi:MAG: DUF2459 domain-containing protein [Planctomycetes bacterium]|nr:DUF2459 domain-containing protein [Planctomycetota bacterium]